jgi:hypothetical protein
MTRVCSIGSIHESIGEALDAAGRKRAADALGVSVSMLSRHADPCDEMGRPMPAPRLDLLARMFPAAAAVIARHFAALAGGSFMPRCACTLSPNLAMADLHLRLGDAAATLLLAIDPSGPGGSEITNEERVQVKAKVAQLIEATLALDAALSGARE